MLALQSARFWKEEATKTVENKVGDDGALLSAVAPNMPLCARAKGGGWLVRACDPRARLASGAARTFTERARENSQWAT